MKKPEYKMTRYLLPTAIFNMGMITAKTMDSGIEAGVTAALAAVVVLTGLAAVNYVLVRREQKKAQLASSSNDQQGQPGYEPT